MKYGWRIVAMAVVAANGLAEGPLHVLENQRLRADFDDRGLVRLEGRELGFSRGVTRDRLEMEVDGTVLDTANVAPLAVERIDQTVRYRYLLGDRPVEIVYELQPDWGFITKHVRFAPRGAHHIKRIEVLDLRFAEPWTGHIPLRNGAYGALGHMDDRTGFFTGLQNPYNILSADQEEGDLSLAYELDMAWEEEWGVFESDRAYLGFYARDGRTYPAQMLDEWRYLREPGAYGDDMPQLDAAGIEALAGCVSAFTTYRPERSVRVVVDWCMNAYQLNLSNPEHWEEYRRIIRMASAVGAEHILYAASDLELAPQARNRDAWGWEQKLWLNMGQAIRAGEWVPGKDPLPDVVQMRIDEAAKHNIRFLAYVYPSLPFEQDPLWTAWVGRLPGSPRPGGYRAADTGIRSFQDWLLATMIAFKEQTGVSGFSFDHWWIAYDDSETSRYAQWYGARRILKELREHDPDIVIDGRQQYHNFGPWTWVGGSYPHPMASDEQPGSFRAFPDLHFSRVSANRTRSRNFWFQVHNFCPVELIPGYMTHQTMRSDREGVMRRDPYRRADWDYLGWKYSVISSIATAPINHVINYLPARKPEEFEQFPEEDQQWFRDWLDWTDEHIDMLRNIRPFLGQPMVGRCDGTAAIRDGSGFIFLFNPNYRPLDASFELDETIGLAVEGDYVFRQLYPDLGKGRYIGPGARGAWAKGDRVTLPMDGASALVLELVRLPGQPSEPILLNVTGSVEVKDGGVLHLTGVSGEPGTEVEAVVRLPSGTEITATTVNGRVAPFTVGEGLVKIGIRFAGPRFAARQQIGAYDPDWTGVRFAGTLRMPSEVLAQLAARRTEWNIPYDEEEILATWNAPWRNLLFINIADPQQSMEVSARIDGEPVEVQRAYSGVHPASARRTFAGFYVDVTDRIEEGRSYVLEVDLPEGLEPGQFQGVFFDAVETRWTDTVR